jgi:hypothetical protein
MTPWGWLGQWRWHGGSNDRSKATLGCGAGLPKGKAMIEEGQQFSIEDLQAAFAEVLAEANGHERVVLEAAMNAVIARKAN